MSRIKEKMLGDRIFDSARADALKADGIEGTLAAEHERWKSGVRAAVERLRFGEEFTSETLQRIVGREPHHPNCWGAIVNALAKQGLCAPTGRYVKSTRVSCHSAVMQVWVKQ